MKWKGYNMRVPGQLSYPRLLLLILLIMYIFEINLSINLSTWGSRCIIFFKPNSTYKIAI